METMTYERLAEIVEDANNRITGCRERKYKKLGVPIGEVAGGLMHLHIIPGNSLEANIQNIISIFTNNFGEAMFFEAFTARQVLEGNTMALFIRKKGLVDEYKQFVNE